MVRSLSQAVNFKQIQPQRTGRFSSALQIRAPIIGRWVKKADIEYPFEHVEVINYTLDGVSLHPVTTKIQAPFLTQLPERKETAQGFHHDGDIKTVSFLLSQPLNSEYESTTM